MRRPPLRALLVLATMLVVVACGTPPPTGRQTPTSQPSSNGTAITDGFACSVGGGTRFASSLLDGPRLSPEGFLETEVGAILHEFFTDGEGAVENVHFRRADGFSIVSDDLVLGYSDGLPDSTFHLDDGRIAGWGGCNPTRMSGDLVAARWETPSAVDIRSQTIPMFVEGGACVTENGQEVITELVEVEVEEQEDEIHIIAWTREKAWEGDCAGVGILLDGLAELSQPLGDRSLVNGGPIPPRQVDFTPSDGPPPSTTIDNSDAWAIGRLDCSPGVLVEERVPDSGQEPIELAQAAAPAVVEVESGQTLWWWGLNQNGAVIVGLALGDVAHADYQVWTCDPPLGDEAP